MAKNDSVLIDGIIEKRVAELIPSSKTDEAFEYFAFEQILREFDFSQDEILSGIVDGGRDGGIDGFYIIINGNLFNDTTDFPWPRSGAEVQVYVLTCKLSDTFIQAPVDKLVATISEFFDFAIAETDLQSLYSEQLLKKRRQLHSVLRKLSNRQRPNSIRLCYASRGDTNKLGLEVTSRARQLEVACDELFGKSTSKFTFFGAGELIEAYRKVKHFGVDLPFLEECHIGERYVLLTTLKDFRNFICEEEGGLRRYLFDSNVRAFMGMNTVNEDIRTTLLSSDSPDFWWLNNGVTILANTATIVGDSIHMDGVQIVNGLQTSESIFRYFEDGGEDPNHRAILVKVIVSKDDAIRDAIIRATNNQSAVHASALHATDRIQRNIEEVLLQHEIYYERRTNFYINLGKSAAEIISPLYLAAGFVSLILKSPSSATKLKNRFMRGDVEYSTVFSEATPILAWPKLARIMKATDEALDGFRVPGAQSNIQFLKNWRHLTAFVAASRIFGTFGFSASQIASVDLDLFTNDMFRSSWSLIEAMAGDRRQARISRSAGFILQVCARVESDFGIAGIEVVEKRADGRKRKADRLRQMITPEFLAQVDELLPAQPWPIGINRKIAATLQCQSKLVSEAIAELMTSGKWNRQVDGIVYDPDGLEIVRDESRHPL